MLAWVGLVADVAYSSSLGGLGLSSTWGLSAATAWFASVDVADEPSWAPFGVAVPVVVLGAGPWGLGRTSEARLGGTVTGYCGCRRLGETVPETDMLGVMLVVMLGRSPHGLGDPATGRSASFGRQSIGWRPSSHGWSWTAVWLGRGPSKRPGSRPP